MNTPSPFLLSLPPLDSPVFPINRLPGGLRLPVQQLPQQSWTTMEPWVCSRVFPELARWVAVGSKATGQRGKITLFCQDLWEIFKAGGGTRNTAPDDRTWDTLENDVRRLRSLYQKGVRKSESEHSCHASKGTKEKDPIGTGWPYPKLGRNHSTVRCSK